MKPAQATTTQIQETRVQRLNDRGRNAKDADRARIPSPGETLNGKTNAKDKVSGTVSDQETVGSTLNHLETLKNDS